MDSPPKADRRPPLTIDKSPDKFYEDFRTTHFMISLY